MESRFDTEHSTSILYMLGQLTAKVDTLLTTQIITNDRHEALETRVSVLEKDKANIIGGALVVSLLVGLGFDYFLK
jgi:hypothetical protein